MIYDTDDDNILEPVYSPLDGSDNAPLGECRGLEQPPLTCWYLPERYFWLLVVARSFPRRRIMIAPI